jgi:hypothetical protein
VTHLVTGHGLPVQRACQAVGLGRATYYRPMTNWAHRDAPLIEALTTLGATNPRWGFWKYVDRLRLTGTYIISPRKSVSLCEHRWLIPNAPTPRHKPAHERDFGFRHSHCGTGCGSCHKPRVICRASSSKAPNPHSSSSFLIISCIPSAHTW